MMTPSLHGNQFLTLHLEIPKGVSLSISTVGRALIEFEKVAKEVALRSDPLVQFEMGFERSEEGSLRLLTTLKEQISEARLKYLARLIIASLLLQPVVGIVSGDYLRNLMEDWGYHKEEMSEQEVQRIATAVTSILKDEDVKKARNNFYQNLEADPLIEGVGIAPDHSPTPPSLVVPREAFPLMGLPTRGEVDTDPLLRSQVREVTLTLEKPILKLSSKALWGFSLGQQSIRAKMEDEAFLDKALTGKTHLPLIEGLQMNVLMEEIQEFKNGGWSVKSYVIREVQSWTLPKNEQPSLPLFESGEK